MDIDAIRKSIRKGNFFVTDHTITEGFKDGISVADMVHAIQGGTLLRQHRTNQPAK